MQTPPTITRACRIALMGVKVPKEIQEIDLLTLRLRTEGSALVHHPWGGKEEEPVSKYS